MAKKKYTEEELKEHRHIYYMANREKVLARFKEKNKKIPIEIRRKKARDYYQSNRDRLLPQQKEYYYKKREENPIHILYVRLKTRAAEKGLEFNIEESDLQIPEVCPFLGIYRYWKTIK